uniref:Uncharacterized protein n=1 Tax=Rhizophora mucronata TaxID=61149 RepID=A0A2P2P351_RHIMU
MPCTRLLYVSGFGDSSSLQITLRSWSFVNGFNLACLGFGIPIN